MKTLLDTCVLSELYHPQGSVSVKSFVEQQPEDSLFISVITLGELTKGVQMMPDSARKALLAAWVLEMERAYAPRILPIDAEVASIWGEVTAKAQRQGVVIQAADGLLAATALRHGLHLVTRNVRHIEASGVLFIDPWRLS